MACGWGHAGPLVGTVVCSNNIYLFRSGLARVSCRATLGVPVSTARSISGWLEAYRKAHDIRPSQRAATNWIRVLLALHAHRWHRS